jgi:hypothetical protein
MLRGPQHAKGSSLYALRAPASMPRGRQPPCLEDASLHARVHVLHYSAHDVPHAGVLLGDIDAVKEISRLHHGKYLKTSSIK